MFLIFSFFITTFLFHLHFFFFSFFVFCAERISSNDPQHFRLFIFRKSLD
uniref:Uncharacterized protein n=1 Tax=Siphoviridae sp. ct5FX1 TaxID=2825335 RepID=A0A8S5UPQ3_9CAUD|nr:MAG TPA: hypothetical protein [Siphoviridae sp. ct5FX1]